MNLDDLNRDDLPELLKPGEVAALWRVDPRTVARWAKAGKLVAKRTPGGHRRLTRESVLRLLNEDGAANQGEGTARHKRYEHPGFGPACGVCSPAAGEPVAWPCGQ